MAKSQGQWWIDKNYPPCMLAQPGIMTVDAQYNIEFDNLFSCVCQIVRLRKLPDTIDETYLKMCVFLAGRGTIFRDSLGDNALRGLDCATVDKPTIYYMPSKILVVNPTFKGYSYTLTPGKDCAVIYCREVDRYQYGRETGGLYGLIATHAQLLADNTISINTATKNMRLTNIIAANDNLTVKSIDEVLGAMYAGVPYKCVRSSLVDQLTSVPMTDHTNTQQLLQLIQARQYIYAHFYEQIGLKTHDQIKKERLISSEVDEGTELAVFNIQDMIATMQNGIDECNRIFGTKIEIELHPLIASTLQDPADGEPEDQTDAQPAGDQIDGNGAAEPADDQTPDYMAAIYQAAAERVAELIRGRPDDEQPEADPEDDQTEAEPDGDQSDGEPEAEQSEAEPDGDKSDGEPEAEQSEAEPDDDQSDAEPEAEQISIEISGDVGGDVAITIDPDQDDPSGGDADA